MKDLYNVIVERLKPLKSVGVNHVDLWNNQQTASDNGEQKPFRYNSLFIEFIVDEVRSIGYGIKSKFLTVRVHMAIKTLKADKSTLIDYYSHVSDRLEGFGSKEGFQPYFSCLYEKGQQFDVDHDNVELPYIEFGTIYTDMSGYSMKTLSNPTGTINLTLSKEINNG